MTGRYAWRLGRRRPGLGYFSEPLIEPGRLTLPVVMDTVYGYQVTNVEAQSRTTSSLREKQATTWQSRTKRNECM